VRCGGGLGGARTVHGLGGLCTVYVVLIIPQLGCRWAVYAYMLHVRYHGHSTGKHIISYIYN